jgi:hypothetical protein
MATFTVYFKKGNNEIISMRAVNVTNTDIKVESDVPVWIDSVMKDGVMWDEGNLCLFAPPDMIECITYKRDGKKVL